MIGLEYTSARLLFRVDPFLSRARGGTCAVLPAPTIINAQNG